MLNLATPLWLFALPLPWLVWWLAQRRKASTQTTAIYHPQAALLAQLSQQARRRLPWFWLLGCSLLLLALARPQWLGGGEHQGRNFMLAIDISSSMKAQDFFIDGRPVNRFDAVKKVATQFIEQRQGDRIGLIVFADDAYTFAPLTTDLEMLQRLIGDIDQGMAGQQTALGQAIALGVKRLEKLDETSRNLILLTDGSNTAGEINPLNALAMAKLRRVKIYTIGVGKPGKVLFQRGPVEKPDFTDVPLDEPLLQQLATESGGRYYRASATEQLSKVMADIEELATIPLEDQRVPPHEWYLLPLLLGLLLLGLSQWRSSREVMA
jgi:Ca-activated chloride channel family protein